MYQVHYNVTNFKCPDCGNAYLALANKLHIKKIQSNVNECGLHMYQVHQNVTNVMPVEMLI